MDFEKNKFLLTTFAMVIVATVVGYFAFQQEGQDSNQATSTDAVVKIGCDNYDANPTSSEFTTDYQKIKNQADFSYHGPDKKGKDGPMAKTGLDLAQLYHEYRAFQCSDSGESFESQVYAAYRVDSSMVGPVRGESIVGDFTASENADGQELASDLRRLGATNVAGPREGVKSKAVSAKIPIDIILSVAQLKSLSHFTPAVAFTKSTGEGSINDNGRATGVDTVAKTNCEAYDNDNSGSEFRPSYMPTFENRQALKQAMISYHGEDMEGKDGPLAAVGFDIALIYHEYQSYKCSNNSNINHFEPESATNSGMSFVNGRFVVGDVSARESATVEKLANDLKDIGVEVTAGPIEGINSNIVSAKIPIDKLPAVARLDSVRSFRPARATTNTSGGNVIAD